MKCTIADAAIRIFCRWPFAMMRNRLVVFRTILLLGLLLLWSLPAAASTLKPVRFMLQWSHQAQFAGYYVALEKGYYRDQGLDVTIVPGGPGLDASAYLNRGDVDFASLWLSTALMLTEQAQPLVNVAQIVNDSNLVLVTRREDTIENIADLSNKKVSIWEGDFRAPYVAWLQSKNVTPRIFPQYYSVNLFLQRAVDACSAMDYNEVHMIYQTGMDLAELKMYALRDYGFGFPEDGVYSLTETVRRDPERAIAFREATLAGWKFAAEHPDETLNIVMRYVERDNVPTNRPHMKWMLEKILDSIMPDLQDEWIYGALSRQDFERTVNVMREQGMLQQTPVFDDFIGGGLIHVP